MFLAGLVKVHASCYVVSSSSVPSPFLGEANTRWDLTTGKRDTADAFVRTARNVYALPGAVQSARRVCTCPRQGLGIDGGTAEQATECERSASMG